MDEEEEDNEAQKAEAGLVAGEKPVGEVLADSEAQAKKEEKKPALEGTHLIKEEERETGLVRPDVIWR